jgi:hypothetical protein
MRILVSFAALCWIIGLEPSLASPREDALAGVVRCKMIADDRGFLDCFYGAAQPLRAELGLAPAPSFQTQLVPPGAGAAAGSGKASGGTGMARAIGDALSASTNLRMASYAFDPRGHFTVTLNDGSVWRQLDRDQAFADWRGPAASYYVSLKSSGNDHFLDVKGGAGPYQVERVR